MVSRWLLDRNPQSRAAPQGLVDQGLAVRRFGQGFGDVTSRAKGSGLSASLPESQGLEQKYYFGAENASGGAPAVPRMIFADAGKTGHQLSN
jgi:hypothetical protein